VSRIRERSGYETTAFSFSHVGIGIDGAWRVLPVRTDSPGSAYQPAEPGAERKPRLKRQESLRCRRCEAALRLNVTLPEQPRCKRDGRELRNARGDLDMLTVTVAPPQLQALSLELTLTSKQAFSDRPLVVRISVLRDGQAIDSQSSLSRAMRSTTRSPTRLTRLRACKRRHKPCWYTPRRRS